MTRSKQTGADRTAPLLTFLFTMLLFVFAACDAYQPIVVQEGEEGESLIDCGGHEVMCLVSGKAGEAGLGSIGLEPTPVEGARHYWPMDITPGPNGVIYIVDWNNHMVQEVTPDGMIRRIIGEGSLGDESWGLATTLNLNHPTSMAIGDDGNFYLGAWHNWKIKLIDSATFDTRPIVGTTQGLAGDGGPAEMAKMDLPNSVVWDFDGNMYIGDQGNQRVRKVDAAGTITTFVGGQKGFADGIGEEARFDVPKGPDAGPGGKIAIDADRTVLYYADTFNHRIRMIDIGTREVTTIIGTGEPGYTGDGGPASAATLNLPRDVYLNHEGQLFIADSENHVIRMVEADGTIKTVAGTGQQGFSDNGLRATESKLNKPHGVGYDEGSHTLYIADTFNHQVKRVALGHDE